MVRSTRRQLLAGVTMAALPSWFSIAAAGETTTGAESSPSETATPTPDSDETALPDDVEAVLDPIPESVDGTQASRLSVTVPSPDQETTAMTMWGAGTDQFDLDEEAVDRVATAIYGENRKQILALVGSFDASDPTVPKRVPENGVHRDDGLFVLGVAPQSGAWTDGLSAAKDAIGDEFEFSEETRLSLAQVVDSASIQVFPSFPPSSDTGVPDIDTDGLETVAIGVDRIDPTAISFSIVGVYTETAAYDGDDFEALLESTSVDDIDEKAIKRDGRVAIGTTRVPAPSEALRERAPDLWLHVQYDAQAGTAKLHHTQEKAVSTEGLALYVDGEKVTNVWNGETFDPEEVITVEADLLSTIVLEWTDPKHPEYQTVVSHELIADGVTFQEDYDRESKTLTLTYTGPEPITATERIEIEHRSTSGREDDYQRQETTERSLGASHETLSPEDEIEIDDVTLYDRVTLSTTHSVERGTVTESTSTSIYYFHAEVPGYFSLDQQDHPTLVYQGREARDPEQYRVTVDGTELSSGLDDEYETLESGDSVSIDADPGAKVLVEWVGPGGPATAFSEYIKPPVSFELHHSTDGFELVYRSDDGYTGDPDAFTVQSHGLEAKTPFAQEYETLADGDSIDIEFDRLSIVTVEWTGPEESVRIDGISLRRMVHFEMDGQSLTFAGEGEWSADAFEMTVDGESIDGFSDTVTEGDSIDLAAETGSTVEVVWKNGSDEETVFSETFHPPFEFDVEYDAKAESLTITSQTESEIDPAEVAVATYASQRTSYPNVWADEYDVIEAGDSITLSVSTEPQALVVEHESWGAYVSKQVA
ncbi:hypothetical protein [Halorhabdus sp. CUG00001]|uniref:hypothetical protein n=1 Tax=Halorhabdus sp. CUG00001 TaxID=2600297 RepID=UPI00131E2A49|nr:hypothetical protein [Halorhabdus sp. CUG00001]